MIDVQTDRPIRVSTDGTGGPYIKVPVPQLNRLRALLEQHQVHHWVESGAVSLDGKPAIAVINLGRGADAAAVQSLLNGAG